MKLPYRDRVTDAAKALAELTGDKSYDVDCTLETIESMQNQRPLKCKYCSLRFKYQAVLKNHIERVHHLEVRVLINFFPTVIHHNKTPLLASK